MVNKDYYEVLLYNATVIAAPREIYKSSADYVEYLSLWHFVRTPSEAITALLPVQSVTVVLDNGHNRQLLQADYEYVYSPEGRNTTKLHMHTTHTHTHTHTHCKNSKIH